MRCILVEQTIAAVLIRGSAIMILSFGQMIG